MALISVTCAQCGHTTEADDSMAGQKLYCPSCKSPVIIAAPGATPADVAAAAPPAAAPELTRPVRYGLRVRSDNPPDSRAVADREAVPQAEPTERLRVAHDRIASGLGKRCPNCDGPMDEGDVVCSSCGFNLQLGRSMVAIERERSQRKQRMQAAATLVVLVALGLAAWQMGWFRRPPKADPKPADAEATVSNAPAAAGGIDSLPKEAVDRTRAEIEAELAARAPLPQVGKPLDLEMTTGRVLRGTFQGFEGAGVFKLGTDEGEIRVDVKQLRPSSRVRMDAEYRSQVVEQTLKQRLTL